MDDIEEVGENDREVGMRLYREGRFQQAVELLKLVVEKTKGCKNE
jgi:hypothetical protein